jgi:alpha-glucosidase (family GH31 glycosyl hydrolase)
LLFSSCTTLFTESSFYIRIDMNEPSNFCDGQCYATDEFADADYNHPPYVPGTHASIFQKTITMSATHIISGSPQPHYNVHNMYGHSEMQATCTALQGVHPNSRCFVISRSTFLSSSRFGGHWLGDNTATWFDLKASISGVLAMNMFGMPFVGADICGFNGNTTAELCTRWMQLGAFYPFARNHNTIGAASQEPYVFDQDTTRRCRNALNIRYTLLPFLYTLLANASSSGSPVVRPLFFEFPDDLNTWADADSQFMWGSALLVSPALYQGEPSPSLAVAGFLPVRDVCAALLRFG